MLTPLKIAKAYGAPINRKVSPKKKLNYNGKHINIKGLTKPEILHELCHWIVATPKQRLMPDYGLGSGFSETGSNIWWPAMIKGGFTPLSNNTGFKAEIEACSLQFIFGAICGVDQAKEMEDLGFIDTWNDECNWVDTATKKNWFRDIKSFKARKLIDKDLVPVKLKSMCGEKERERLKNFRKLIDKLNA